MATKPSRAVKSYKTKLVDIQNGDCLDLLRKLPESSVDFIVTDPPYFLDQLGDEWNDVSIVRNIKWCWYEETGLSVPFASHTVVGTTQEAGLMRSTSPGSRLISRICR